MTVALAKPFKTIDEQIQLLNRRGLKTDEATYGILEREGYYPVINGYKDLFIDAHASIAQGSDVYIDGASFNDIYRLFVFDRDLRSTLMRYFAMAEASLKTVCSYQFTLRHPSEKNPYMNERNYGARFQESGKAGKLIEELGKAIGNDEKSTQWKKKSYIKHYVDNHNGEVPLWVLMNYITLGQAFRFFCFMDDSTQNSIAKSFSRLYSESYGTAKMIHPRVLRLAYDHIKDFRNICAHDERLFCARVSPSSDTPLAKVLDDLELVLSKDQLAALKADVSTLMSEVVSDIDLLNNGFAQTMGFKQEDI